MTDNIKCFLVDDDADDQEIFSMAVDDLEKSIDVITAYNCIEAVEKLENDHSFIPNCIFIDINMPKINGIDCLKAIKKLDWLESTPVYMYSTSADPRIIEESMQLGAKDFIVKPTQINELSEILGRIFNA
jgi:DNA-binding NtrC family response regulator